MKLLQVHTFYPGYLAKFDAGNPGLALASYRRQIELIIADGFSGTHLIAPHLAKEQFDAQLIAANWPLAQQTWAKENGVSPKLHPYLILQKQISQMKPDVIYFTNPIVFDSRFVRSLEWKPKLIIGWRAAEVPKDTDWTEFDAIISNNPPTLVEATEHGAKAVERFAPGFPRFLADAVKDEEEQNDAVFIGSWSSAHTIRNKIWIELSKSLLKRDCGFGLRYHLLADDPAHLPLAASMHDHGARFGLAMHREIKRARVNLNALSHVGETISANMRLFEIAGTGGFQLMEYHSDITNYFEPGREIASYTGVPDMIEKIEHYLAHPEERRAIARAGQERCLREHSMERRVNDFAEIVRTHLARTYSSEKAAKSKPASWSPPSSGIQDELKAEKKRTTKLEEKLRAAEAELAQIKGSVAWKSSRWIRSIEKRFHSKKGGKQGS